MNGSTPPRLELRGIVKRYPAVLANDRIDLKVAAGQIHAVLGENGAGKSTLMKIVYGAVQPDAGEIRFDGRAVRIASPAAARALGISMVYQHFSLFDTLSAAQNVWLGLDRGQTLEQVSTRMAELAGNYGLDVDPARPVASLSVGERQRVEILRALMTDPSLLILDEPTSVLTPQAVDKLFETLRRLSERGTSILYISHKLDEIRALCHHCTVLRGGRVTGEVDPRRETNASLSRLMIGSEPPALKARAGRRGAVVLQTSGLGLPKRDPFATALRGVSLAVHAGEIVGVAGVSGNGQQELLAAFSGEHRLAGAAADCLRLFGQPIGALSPQARRERGLHFVPEERLGRGAVPPMSLAHNTLLTRREHVGRFGWLAQGRIAQAAEALIARFQVKAGGAGAAARSLSGGNLQKFIVGREIDAAPKCLVVSQPTWGVDVGAAALIRGELLALREAGCAVLVVSEELDELFEICDRLVVIAQGRISPPIAVADASPALVGEWMSGLWPAEAGLQEGARAEA
jgi:simple sugar transport system ATP-binding protein